MTARVVIVRPFDYFEIGVFLYATLWGVVSLFRYDLAASSLRAYPGHGGLIFLALLIIGGVIGLYSWTLKTITGPRLERSALTFLSLLCLAYVVWTPFSVGVRGISFLLAMAILIAGPGGLKARRLTREIRKMEEIAEEADRQDRG